MFSKWSGLAQLSAEGFGGTFKFNPLPLKISLPDQVLLLHGVVSRLQFGQWSKYQSCVSSHYEALDVVMSNDTPGIKE